MNYQGIMRAVLELDPRGWTVIIRGPVELFAEGVTLQEEDDNPGFVMVKMTWNSSSNIYFSFNMSEITDISVKTVTVDLYPKNPIGE